MELLVLVFLLIVVVAIGLVGAGVWPNRRRFVSAADQAAVSAAAAGIRATRAVKAGASRFGARAAEQADAVSRRRAEDRQRREHLQTIAVPVEMPLSSAARSTPTRRTYAPEDQRLAIQRYEDERRAREGLGPQGDNV